MSITDNVLEKLGMSKPATIAPSAPSSKETKDSAPAARTFSPNPPNPTFVPPATPAKPVEMPMVDVVSKLDNLAKASPIELKWKVSINDLMALLGMDHSPAAIKELAVELGCPESEMNDSYKRNVWTHKALLKKIAENGGNIPQKLLD
jgi:hypothetical protein